MERTSEQLVVWEDPPPATVPRWHAVYEELKARPGQWALIHTKTDTTFHLGAWHTPLISRDDIEHRFCWTANAPIFGRPYKLYARWTGGH